MSGLLPPDLQYGDVNIPGVASYKATEKVVYAAEVTDYGIVHVWQRSRGVPANKTLVAVFNRNSWSTITFEKV